MRVAIMLGVLGSFKQPDIAVGATVDMVEKWRKPMVSAVNSATKRARITAEAAVALSQHGTVAPVTLHHRVDFAASMIDGRTVMEVSESGASAKEVIALWNYVAERLGKLDVVQPMAAANVTEVPAAAAPTEAVEAVAHSPAPVASTATAQHVAPAVHRTDADDMSRPSYGVVPRRPAATFGRRIGGEIQ